MVARTSRAAGSLWRSMEAVLLQPPRQVTVKPSPHSLHPRPSHTEHGPGCERVRVFYIIIVALASSWSYSSALSSLSAFHIWRCSGYLASFCSLDPQTGGVPACDVSCRHWRERRGSWHCSQRDGYLPPSLR